MTEMSFTSAGAPIAPRAAPAPVMLFELTSTQSRLLGENLNAVLARLETGAVSDAERIGALDPIKEVIVSVRECLGAPRPPLVRIRGLPVDTMDRGRPLPHPTPRADAFLHGWACAHHRQPMVFGEARPGQTFQHVFPLPDSLDKPHAHGAASIRWHIDGGGYPSDLVPDRMGLLGIENTTGVPTALASINVVMDALPPSTARLLEQPLYRYHLPNRRGGVDKQLFTPWLPLVTRRPSEPTITYMFPYVLPQPDTGAAEAITALERAATEHAVRIPVERGDFVFWANGPFMHSRAAITGVAEGGIRWFKRLFALKMNRYNREALGPDHIIRAEPELLARLMPRYRV